MTNEQILKNAIRVYEKWLEDFYKTLGVNDEYFNGLTDCQAATIAEKETILKKFLCEKQKEN